MVQAIIGIAMLCTTVVGAWRHGDAIVQFGTDSKTVLHGVTYKYAAADGAITLTGSDGVFTAPYTIAGGVMTLTLDGETAAMTCVPQGIAKPADLAGRWTHQDTFLQLNANGTYEAGPEPDQGAWTAAATTLSLKSRVRGAAVVYTLERRNDPKTKAPLLVLDGKPFASSAGKPGW